MGWVRVAGCFVAAWALACPARAEVLPSGLKVERVLDNAVELGDLAQSPTGELWLLERTTGTVRRIVDGAEDASLVLPVRTTCDSGLLDIAFGPDYLRTGRAFVSYVDPAGSMLVRELVRVADGIATGAVLLDLGPTPGCRPGGGLAVGPDRMLYVGVGDLEDPGAAQSDVSLSGKVLRVRFDGSIPSDNPDPTSLVLAKGFRHVADLDVNQNTTRPNGTVYAIDVGATGTADDEVNAARPGGNHGWSLVSGDSGGTFDDPLVSFQPAIGSAAIAALTRSGLGPHHLDTVVHAATGSDELRQIVLAGGEGATTAEARVFFDPDGDADGTPDTGCPQSLHALEEGRDGMLYAAGHGANPGIWRIWSDGPGPREVSPPGSPFPLRIRRTGSQLTLFWEDLGPLDAGRPARNGAQHAGTYQIWEGTLPLPAGYDHVSILTTDGLPDGTIRREASITPAAGDHYYLVSAQGDNLEGSTGADSMGSARDLEQDYCGALGYGNLVGDCIDDFRHPTSGVPMKLVDYNPRSPTYLQPLSIRDFRGKVVHLDIAAADCFWCNLQAPTFPDVERDFRGRDFVLVEVMNESEFVPRAYADAAACAAGIEAWADAHGLDSPILCDVDLNLDGLGDVSNQFFHTPTDPQPCGGFSQNIFIDQGGVIFDFGCSATLGDEVTAIIAPEINPETCE